MVICAIVGCGTRSCRDNIPLFRIPSVDLRRNYKSSELILNRQKLWITRIKRENFSQAKIKNARICSKHFISGKIVYFLLLLSRCFDLFHSANALSSARSKFKFLYFLMFFPFIVVRTKLMRRHI